MVPISFLTVEIDLFKNSSDNFGVTHKSITGKPYPITGVVGDQQAATIGQCCFDKGSVKSTYGTGAFVLMNTGNKKIYSKNRLLTTIAYKINGKTTYAMEGSIFIAGAGVQWLRDKLKLVNNAYDTERIAQSKKAGGKIFIEGQDLLNLNNKELIDLRRNKMGMVFQSFALLPHKTVIENIAFPLQIKGMKTSDSISKSLEMAKLVGLKIFS